MVPWTRVYEQLPWRPQGTQAAVNSDEMCGLLRSPKEIRKCTHAFVKHCRESVSTIRMDAAKNPLQCRDLSLE